jgi:hypothetical protein
MSSWKREWKKQKVEWRGWSGGGMHYGWLPWVLFFVVMMATGWRFWWLIFFWWMIPMFMGGAASWRCDSAPSAHWMREKHKNDDGEKPKRSATTIYTEDGDVLDVIEDKPKRTPTEYV